MMDTNDVRFFNVALKHGHPMARPKHEPEFSFVGSLVQEMERIGPEFAWVQLLFEKADLGRDLLRLKSGLHAHKKEADRDVVKVDLVSGEERTVENPLKRREWYRRIESRSKAIDELTALPHAVMGVQGMWAGDVKELKNLHAFSNCVDEGGHDSLKVFSYRDPRMLSELVRRRFVEDLHWYFEKYHLGGREEPPSLVLAAEDLPYYVHVPAGVFTKTIKSIKFRPPPDVSAESEEGEVVVYEGVAVDLKVDEASGMVLLGVPTFPLLKEDFKEKDQKTGMLNQLASTTRRTFELVYEGGKTTAVIGAESPKDMESYVRLLVSVYGGLDYSNVDSVPGYVRKLANALVPRENQSTPQ